MVFDRWVIIILFDYLEGVCNVARISAGFGGVLSWLCQVLDHSERIQLQKPQDISERVLYGCSTCGWDEYLGKDG